MKKIINILGEIFCYISLLGLLGLLGLLFVAPVLNEITYYRALAVLILAAVSAPAYTMIILDANEKK